MSRAAPARAGLVAFGSAAPLDDEALHDAPVRWPRPSRLAEPLRVSPAPAAKGADALGLATVGDLLAHLPHDRREARTVAALTPGETATVVVEVRNIRSRPVRRRGMRPLVEATVADATGPMKATFFNQPWLERKYSPGTRLVLHGKYRGRNAFTVQSHAPTADAVAGADAVAHYPASEGITSTQILALVREHRDELVDVLEPLPARLRAGERLPDRAAALTAVHFPDAEGDAPGGRRRLAFDELLLLQLALLRRRALRRDRRGGAGARRPARADGPLAARGAAVRPDGGPGPRDRTGLRGPGGRASHAAAADGRGRVGQDRGGAGRDAARRRARDAGGAHGPHRDAGRAALRDDPAAARSRVGDRGAAHRLDPGRAPRRRPGEAGQRRALAGGRHPRADRGGRRIRSARRRRGGRAASLRRAPACHAGPQGGRLWRGRAPPARALADRDADPAHARADRLRRPRHHRAARASLRAQAHRDPRGGVRARARARVRAHPRGAARRAPGVRRVPAGGGVRGARGARRDRGVRAPRPDRVRRLRAWCCSTARCARAPSRRRWRRSPRGGPTCSWRRR